MYKIYERFNPVNPSQKYIGVTRNSVELRMHQDKKDAKHKFKHNKPLSKIQQLILDLDTIGVSMKFVIIDTADTVEDAMFLEKFWITQYKWFGFELLNTMINNTIYHGNHGIEAVPCSCYDLNGNFIKSFLSLTAASNYINVDKTVISRVCSGIKISAGNLQWRFGNSIENIGSKRKCKLHIPIFQYDLQGNFITKYDSTRSALAQFGADSSENLISCLDKPGRSSFDYQWRSKYYESIPVFIKKTTKSTSQGVVAYNKLTGDYVGDYDTAVIALSSLGISNGDRSAIYKCCKGKFLTYKGYIWKYRTSSLAFTKE